MTRIVYSVMTAMAALAGAIAPSLPAIAQAPAEDGSVFADPSWVPARSSTTPALRRVINVDFAGVAVHRAINEVTQLSGIAIGYGDDVMSSSARVTLRRAGLTVREVLIEALRGTGLEAYISVATGRVVVRKALPDGAELRQVGTVVGRVTEAEANTPILNAQVAIDGAGRAITDAEGRYRILDVPAGVRTISVTSIGYQLATREVDVPDGDTVTVDFALEVSPSALDELVVTVTGQQRRVELGNAIATIRADSVVREAPVNSLTDLISGRVAGVQVMASSGLAGSTPRIRIRGLSSAALTNDPIVVIDGVRVDNSTGFTSQGGIQQSGRLNDLNPEEIESLEVVKGPSAATLYGTEAANGVIVITTKRGRAGPPRWSAWTEQGLSTKAVDEFRESFIAWGHTATDLTPRRCTIQNAHDGACVVDSIASFNPLNLKETSPFATGHLQEYGLQVSGGSERIRYLLSGELSNEDGYLRMPPAEVERMEAIHGAGALSDPDFQRPNTQRKVSLRANLNAGLGDRAELSASASYVNSRSLLVSSAFNTVLASAAFGPGFRDENNGYTGSRTNPGESFATKRAETVDHFLGSLSAQWQPAPWLATRGTVGLDVGNSEVSAFSPPGIGVTPAGRIENGSVRNVGHSVDFGATATAPLARRIRSATSVGIQYNRRDRAGLFNSVDGLLPGSSSPVGATGTPVVSRTNDESYVVGAYVQEQLSLNDRVFVIGAVRADGGSAFGDDVALAAYPKASVSWLISEEPFFPRWPALNSLRLRAAWGASGVQPRRADVIRSYSQGTAIVDGQVASGVKLAGLGNLDLKPERQREVELGFETELFDHRVSLEATYYDRVSKDALVSVPVLPSSPGLDRLENLGSVRNRGIEGVLRMTVLDSRPVSWEVRVAGSYTLNRLLELAPTASATAAGSSLNSFRHVEGFPVFGVWERPVDFDDIDGDGVITAAEVQLGDTMVFFGPSHPPRELAIASTVSLFDGRVRIATQFDHRGGHVRYDQEELVRCFLSVAVCRGLNDPSAPLAAQAQAQAVVQGSANPIRDASFTRFRELAVTYFARGRLTELLGGRRVSVTLGGRNLALWTDFPGNDPEATLFLVSGQPDRPVDRGGFPPARSWSLRVQVGT